MTVTDLTFKQVMARAVEAIDYDNFKNSVDDHVLHECYSQVWGTMHRL